MNTPLVLALRTDGGSVDVTEGVRTLYDHLIHSLDWGSGFLTTEEAVNIITVAQQCGFLMPADAARQFERYAIGPSYQGRIRCVTCYQPVRVSSYRDGEPLWAHEQEPTAAHDPQLWAGVFAS